MKSFLEYLIEDSDNTVMKFTDKVSKSIFAKFNTAIQNIKEDYAKCMAVVSLIDSNGGNLSEKILAYYLSTQEGIKAERVGGAQELTDIKISIAGKTINMSLKTYDSSARGIDLGSNLTKVPAGSVAQIAKELNKNISKYKVENFTGKSGKKRKAVHIAKIKDKSIKNAIDERINAIIEKLCGSTSQPEVFCYIEKIKSKNQLKSFRFNTFAFDRNKLLKLLNDGYISITDGAYGILIKPNDAYVDIVLAQAKNQLTISSNFLHDVNIIKSITHAGHSESISLDIDSSKKLNKNDLFAPLYSKDEKTIDDAYIKSLVNMYNTLVKAKDKTT